MKKEDIQRQLGVALKTSPYRGNVRKISLFGSHLHGSAREDSDIDLLIEFLQPISFLQLARLERDLGNALGRKVELSTPNSLSRYFREDVLREAEPLFPSMR